MNIVPPPSSCPCHPPSQPPQSFPTLCRISSSWDSGGLRYHPHSKAQRRSLSHGASKAQHKQWSCTTKYIYIFKYIYIYIYIYIYNIYIHTRLQESIVFFYPNVLLFPSFSQLQLPSRTDLHTGTSKESPPILNSWTCTCWTGQTRLTTATHKSCLVICFCCTLPLPHSGI